MALSPMMMLELCKLIKPDTRIASFGYPDIVGDAESVLKGRTVIYRQDSHAICKRHGLEQHPIPDADSFFKVFGAKLDVYDIVKERGNEILCDLNFELTFDPPNLDGLGYDYVLDVGTLEHCFNIGQAVKNMAGMVKVGGLILHENPFSWGNHGFYGLNPTFYTDFYEQNGFRLLASYLVLKDGRCMNAPKTSRFHYKEPVEANVFAMAERVEDKPFVWPVQTKYKKLLG